MPSFNCLITNYELYSQDRCATASLSSQMGLTRGSPAHQREYCFYWLFFVAFASHSGINLLQTSHLIIPLYLKYHHFVYIYGFSQFRALHKSNPEKAGTYGITCVRPVFTSFSISSYRQTCPHLVSVHPGGFRNIQGTLALHCLPEPAFLGKHATQILVLYIYLDTTRHTTDGLGQIRCGFRQYPVNIPTQP